MATTVRDTNLAIVRRLCEAWYFMPLSEFRDLLGPDCVYINVPRLAQKRIGPDAAFAALEPWRTRAKIDLQVLHIQGDDKVVFCERLEKFENVVTGEKIDLLVTGVFEMINGKIAQWRDYYESAQSPSKAWLAS